MTEQTWTGAPGRIYAPDETCPKCGHDLTKCAAEWQWMNDDPAVTCILPAGHDGPHLQYLWPSEEKYGNAAVTWRTDGVPMEETP